MNWILMPVLAGPEMTEAAISDCLAQSVRCNLLIINQGVEDAFRDRLERIAEEHPEQVFLWSHMPPLLSLGASWNRALDFVWASGGEEALVVNNDVRLHAQTYALLSAARAQADALFVSAVGVNSEAELGFGLDLTALTGSRGGPDFSCFLISKACHAAYRFDENFIPAYCVTPDTLVLTTDLRWRLIGDLHPGDWIVGVDEEDTRAKPGKYRRRCYRPARITTVQRRLAPCLRITLSDGRHVDCSVDHRWLAKYAEPTNTPYQWREAQGLKVGQRIATPLDTWHDPTEVDEGWLAGICDGEGTLRLSAGNRCEVHIAQKEGPVLDRIRGLLMKFGLPFTGRIRPENGVGVIEIGVRRHALRLLGQIRPIRLLQSFRWEDLSVFSRSAPMDVEITSILHLGTQEVVTVETTSKTYIANGMIAHNCEDLDYHRRLMLAGEGGRIFSINLPYHHLAAQTLKQVDPQKRMKIEAQIGQGSRTYYVKKWGGPVNQERFWVPFGGGFAESDNIRPDQFKGFPLNPTTPEIQAWYRTSTHPPSPPVAHAEPGYRAVHDLVTRAIDQLDAERRETATITRDRRGEHGIAGWE